MAYLIVSYQITIDGNLSKERKIGRDAKSIDGAQQELISYLREEVSKEYHSANIEIHILNTEEVTQEEYYATQEKHY